MPHTGRPASRAGRVYAMIASMGSLEVLDNQTDR